MSNPMLPALYKIHSIYNENHDTFTLSLKSQNNYTDNSFLPGQFNMLYVFGVGEVPISISGSPRDDGTLVHTTRSVGTVTGAMQRLFEGDTIGVRGPFGSCWPVSDADGSDLLFIAGGLGLAPLRSAIYEVLCSREDFGEITLLYGARSPEDIIFIKELESCFSDQDIRISISVDHAAGGWKGKVGVVTSLIPGLQIRPENTKAFICGPEIMMKYTVVELLKRGIEEDDIFVSLERNMKCATGFCGHCQYGPEFICKDGPVFCYSRVKDLLRIREL